MTLYTHVKSLCCTPKTNSMLCQFYFNKKEGGKKVNLIASKM